MTYGLFTVGLQEVGLNKLQVTMYQMLRTIIGDHAYVTGNTHQQTLSQHRCATPLQLLLRAVQQQQRSVAQRSLSLDETDIVKSLQWTTLSASEQVILDAIHQGPAVPIHPDPAEVPDVTVWLQCPQCSFETNNTANMLRHYTNVHREQQLRTHQVDFSRDSLDGLPKCRHCLRLFTTWNSFKRHVERRSCQVPFAIRTLRQPTTQPSAVLSSNPHDSGSQLRVVPRLRGMNSASDGELRVKLLPCDLAHLHSSAPGAFILEVVNSMNWPQLLQDGEACRQLTSTCTLCGIYVGQVRELLAHLKLYHADLMTHVLAKSAQLTLVHAKESPCRFCSKTFKTGHICPVMVQLALLLVNGGGMDLSQGMRCVRTILHCEICGADHDDVRGIQQHLREAHKLAMQDWNVSRDAVGGTQCAHCGSQHVSTEALRRHITFGHCSNFDYARSAETQPLDDDLVQALRQGTLSQLLSDTLVRSRLTLSCQCCGESYSRSPDLAAHLQLCHGRLWTQAVPLTNMLTDIVLREQGCVCNPSTSIPVSVHVCIGLKQTAMQFLRMPDAILVPFEHSETHLRRVLHQSLPAATVNVIAQNVIQRSFSAIWQDPEIIQLLRQQCVLCGKHFHAADLGRHLCQDHDCMAGFTLHFLKQIAKILEPTMLESSVCTACGLAFALLPGLDPIQHQQALKAHLSGLCPTVLQSATLLACKPHGLENGAVGTEPARRDLPGHGQPSGPSPPDSRSGCKTTTRSRPSAKSKHAPTRSRSRTTSASANSGPIGQRDERHAKARFLRLFPCSGKDVSPPSVVGTGNQMEADARGVQGAAHDSIPPDLPDAPSCAGTPAQGSEDSSSRPERSAQNGGPAEGDHPCGRVVAVPEVVLPAEMPTDSEAISHHCSEDGTDMPGSDRSSATGILCDPISQPETSSCQGGHSTMEIEGLNAHLRPACSADNAVWQCGVADHGLHNEESLSASKQPGTTIATIHESQEGQGQRQRQESLSWEDLLNQPAGSVRSLNELADDFRAKIADLALSNLSHWCYANSAWLATSRLRDHSYNGCSCRYSRSCRKHIVFFGGCLTCGQTSPCMGDQTIHWRPKVARELFAKQKHPFSLLGPRINYHTSIYF